MIKIKGYTSLRNLANLVKSQRAQKSIIGLQHFSSINSPINGSRRLQLFVGFPKCYCFYIHSSKNSLSSTVYLRVCFLSPHCQMYKYELTQSLGGWLSPLNTLLRQTAGVQLGNLNFLKKIWPSNIVFRFLSGGNTAGGLLISFAVKGGNSYCYFLSW